MYLTRCDEQFIISQSPKLALIPGAGFAFGGFLFSGYALYHLTSSNFNNPVNWLPLVMGTAFFIIGYRISSPFFLSIDRVKQTYQGYRNWFPFRQKLAGVWADFDHLSVRFTPGKTGTWTVELHWRDKAREPFTLYLADGRTVGLEEARGRGLALSERLGEEQAEALASSPLRFFFNDKEFEARHQAIVLASLLNLPLVDENNQPIG
jgi:hypothetical protein